MIKIKKQVNFRLEEIAIKRLKHEAVEKNKSFQDILTKYLVLGMSFNEFLNCREDFKMPADFEIIKTSYETLFDEE